MAKEKTTHTSQQKTFKRFFNLFTSDLSLNEMERLIKRDAPGVYDFYVRDMEKPDEKKNAIARMFIFFRNLFEAFLMKLTPARRIVYLITLLLFLYAVFSAKWNMAGMAFLLLNILLAFELADKLTAKDELEVARDIQMSLMPRKAPQNPLFDIVCFSEAAREVGGDYYDFIQNENNPGIFYIIIGDISGKGMAAALRMVQVQAILRHLIKIHPQPADALKALNDNFQQNSRREFFLTMTIARINGNGCLTYCRAGHMPLLHFCMSENKCREITPAGLGLGMPENGKFNGQLEEVELKPEPGDIFIFYTDGIIETMNHDREEFGEWRLHKIVKNHAHQSAAEIKEAILKALAQFRGSTPPNDDLTLIVMKAKSKPE